MKREICAITLRRSRISAIVQISGRGGGEAEGAANYSRFLSPVNAQTGGSHKEGGGEMKHVLNDVIMKLLKEKEELLEACKELLFESEKGRCKDNRPIAMAQGKAQQAISKAEGK